MQGARSFVSSRMFGKDERPVPNIVAIYEKPRHKVRRDATHVFGGMFGWNKPEETERALRAEDARAEEAAATTPTTSIPSDVVADSTLSGLAQQSGKRPVKRSKRRALVPLADMGASILSSHFQELMRRQQGIEEPEEQPPLSPPAKRPSADVEDTSAVAEPVSGKKARVSATSADPPVTKKLRLTISTASATPLQLPLSPPDTSSNASKAPADERPGPVSSTPKAALSRPDFPEFDLSNLSGTFSLSPIDSDSESESSSESSSSSSSDSPDLSSSTSTRSTPKEQSNQPKEKEQPKRNAASNGRNNTPSAPASSTRGPSTPPRKKRPTHKPGWIGWVQTEELIRLDDAPVILGRRTRSGKEFQDPLPPPIRKRPAPAPSAPKPNTDQPPRQNKPRPRPSKASRRTGQKSKQQSAWQEAQRRANGESGSASEGRAEGEQTTELAVGDGELHAASADASVPGEDAASSQVGPDNMASSTLASSASPSPTPIKLSPSRSMLSALSDPAPSVSVMEAAPASPVAVLKLTRSDAVITPTGARPNEEKDGLRKNPSFFRFTASPAKDTTHTNTLASPDSKRSVIKDAQWKPNETTSRPESKSLHGTTSASALASSSKTSVSTRPSDKAINKATSDRTSPEKGGPMSELSENSPTLPMTTGGKSKEEKLESSTRHSAALAQFASKSSKLSPTKTSTSGDTALASSSASSKAVKPFPMFAPNRSDSKAETSSKGSAKPSPLVLGKRKDSSGHSFPQIRLKKRKLLWSSSDESETPKFIVNPFDRRAKQMELTRKGLSGDAFQAEMKKWMDSKKAEWKVKEREKAKDKDKDKDKEVVSGSTEVRTAAGESSAPKLKPESVRALANFGTRPKGTDTQPRKRVWNVDWGMEFAKVSVAPHAINTDKHRSLKMKERKDPEGERDRRNSDVGACESHAGRDRRESDAADRPYSALAKPKSRV